MGATSTVSLEEYLASHPKPDVDYVDGVLEERNVGEYDHSKLQGRIIIRLAQAGFQFVCPELRVRVSATRCRVPDVCVFLEEPTEPVPTKPPVLAVEILSPEDRMSRIMARCDDYIAMGCPCVWVLDPALRKAYVYDGQTMAAATGALAHPAIPALRVALADLGF